MIKRKKILKIGLLLVLIFSIKTIYAAEITMPYININSGKGGSSGEPKKQRVEEFQSGIHRYYCDYNNNLALLRKVYVNAYDMKGRTIIPYVLIPSVEFKAGTFIGMNVQEAKQASWNLTDYDFYERKKQYLCTYALSAEGEKVCEKACDACSDGQAAAAAVMKACSMCSVCKKPPQPTPIVEYYREPNEEECPTESGFFVRTAMTLKDDNVIVKLENEVPECMQKAADDTSDIALYYVKTPSINIDIIDPNDYDSKKVKLLSYGTYNLLIDKDILSEQFGGTMSMPTKEIDDPNEIKTRFPPPDYEPKQQDEYHARYEYGPEKTCINVKTSDVYYAYHCDHSTEKNKFDTSSLKEIPKKTTFDSELGEEMEYWDYFIPLDTTTTKYDGDDLGFFISITDRKNEGMDNEYCRSIIEYLYGTNSRYNYKEILMLVINNQYGEFKGDYNGPDSETPSEDLEMLSDPKYSCILSAKVKFNITQKFYGEVVGEKKEGKTELSIKGYGFYYRPIDVNKPFPNEIASDSIWMGLYDYNTITVKDKDNNEIKTVNLDDSFGDITYSTQEVSLTEVREKIVNEYTNWKEMELNGLSKFVDELGLRRSVNLKEIYKLGCGPDNLDWEGCK